MQAVHDRATLMNKITYTEATVRTLWVALGIILFAFVCWGIATFAGAHWSDMKVARPQDDLNIITRQPYETSN